MFSGVIAFNGTVHSLSPDRGGARLVIAAPEAIADGVMPKDSIAINGACLTVVAHDARTMTFDVVPETLARTVIGKLRADDRVNVELSLRLGDRLGGHLVYGHVDATALIVGKVAEGQGWRLTLERPPELARHIVEKGYVAIDGVSMTVASVSRDRFTIALIPETSARTTLGTKHVGDGVNLEVDPIARYAIAAAASYQEGAQP